MVTTLGSIKKSGFVLALSFLFILCFSFSTIAGPVQTPEIGYTYIQNRVHEDGYVSYRLGFDLEYDPGPGQPPHTILNESGTQLFSPYNSVDPLPLFGWWQGTYTEIYASYDGATLSSRTANSGIWYSAQINQSLVAGDYTLKVAGDEGLDDTKKINFSHDGAGIPVVRSTSFTKMFDSSGNFIWNWDVPTVPPGADTSIRAMIHGEPIGDNPWDLVVTIPTGIEQLIIPHDWGIEWGSLEHIEFAIQLRSNDQNYRTYSNWLTLDDIPNSPVPIPAAAYLLGAGFVGIAGLRRKQKR